MSTDAFDDVKRPIKGQMREISQATHVEVISAQQEIITPAFGLPSPNVEVAMRGLAYGKTQRVTSPQEVGSITPIPPPSGSLSSSVVTASAYGLTGDGATAFKKTAAGLRYAKESSKLRTALTNTAFGVVKQDIFYSGSPDPCSEDPADNCKVDLAVVLDDTGSMGGTINGVKSGIQGVADLVELAVGQNYRFSLTTFKDSVTTRLPFSNLCGSASLTAFKSAVNGVGASGGGDGPEWSAAAVKHAAEGRAGSWREGNIVRVLIVLTDNINNYGVGSSVDSGVSVNAAASACAAMNIRVIFAGTPMWGTMLNEADTYISMTGGVMIQTARDGLGVDTLLTSYIFALCGAGEPLSPECEGGIDKIVNGKFDTGIEGWIDKTTLSGRSIAWYDTDERKALELDGAAGQTATGMEGGDLVVLGLDVLTEVVPPTSSAATDLRSQAALELPEGYSIIEHALWDTGALLPGPNNTGATLGWVGLGAHVVDHPPLEKRLQLTGYNDGFSTSTFDDKYVAATADGDINIYDTDGTYESTLLATSDHIINVEIDMVRGHVFYLINGQEIYRMNYDGTGSPILIASHVPIGGQIYAFDIDPINNVLVHSSVRGTTYEILINNLDNHVNPGTPTGYRVARTTTDEVTHIKIDTNSGHIYWIEEGVGTASLKRASYDGDVQNIVTDLWGGSGTGSERVSGIDIGFDPANPIETTIYLSLINVSTASIAKVRIETLADNTISSVTYTETFIDCGGAPPQDVLFDPIAGRIVAPQGPIEDAGQVAQYLLGGRSTSPTYFQPSPTKTPRSVKRIITNGAAIAQTFAVATDDLFAFSANIDTVTDGSVIIQLVDGDTVLNEAYYNPGATSFAAVPDIPAVVINGETENTFTRFRPQVLGGTVLDRSEYPVVVKCGHGGVPYFGSGVLITDRHVLTAAHVTYRASGTALADNEQIVQVYTGGSPPEVNMLSRKIYRHPDWNPAALSDPSLLGLDTTNDIAIIELAGGIQGLSHGDAGPPGSPVMGHPLISSDLWGGRDADPVVGDDIDVYGYGPGEVPFDPDDYGILRRGTTEVEEVTSTLIKWQYMPGEETTLPGDSGGPLMVNKSGLIHVVGVVSGGPASPGFGGGIHFNTKVSAYAEWIYGIINGPQITATVPESGQVTAVVRLVSNNGVLGEADIEAALTTYQTGVPSGLGRLRYQLRNSSEAVLAGDSVTIEDLQPAGESTRFNISAEVPSDGEVEVFFTAEDGGAAKFIVDNVLLCLSKIDDCGPGQRNAVLNPNFERGVENWTDGTGVPLPTTDRLYWDQDIQAIVTSLAGAPEIRTAITDLRPDTNMVLDFEIAVMSPATIPTLTLAFGARNISGDILASDTITLGDIEPLPARVQVTFSAPADGQAIIFMKSGGLSGLEYSGTTKIRNVLVCNQAGRCESGYDRISYDDFELSKGTWSGGTLNAIDGSVTLGAASGATPGETLSQSFTDITPGTEFQLTFNSITNANGVGRYLVSFIHGSVTDQFTTDGAAGIKTYEIVAQADIITVRIRNLAEYDADLDDILICEKAPPPCDGSIEGLRGHVEFKGIPRRPINVFNAIARYTIRDPDDPFDVSEVTHAAETEGHLGAATCDLWKQQGDGGFARTDVLGSNLTLINDIDDGDLVTITSRPNWLWSIPQTGDLGQDSLIIEFPDPPSGLIESVDIYLLMNRIEPSGSDTAPVYPPPLDCLPDPAIQLNTLISFTNSLGLNKEFSVTKDLADLLEEETDYTPGFGRPPWDTDTPLGLGFSGTTARWEKFSFPLDLPDGKGLDQCTTPIFFSAIGTGQINFGEFYISTTGGIFVDPCEAVIEVEEIGSGSATNEIQSIRVPASTGGSFDISLTYSGTTDTVTVPYGSTAAELAAKLAELSNIGNIANVSVGGTGSDIDPYLVEFTGSLAGVDMPYLIPDGTNLEGAASAYVVTDFDGTPNERKTVAKKITTTNDFFITFEGVTSVPFAHSEPIGIFEAKLELMSTIGAGNVRVTGDITDRDALYEGPWYIEFINVLGNQNVAEFTIDPATDYSVVTDWTGGPGEGKDETQTVHVSAYGGTFKLNIANPDHEATDIEIVEARKGSAGGGATVNEEQWVMASIDSSWTEYSLTPSGTITGGTFDLTIDGVTKTAIPYNITAYNLHELFWSNFPKYDFHVDGGATGADAVLLAHQYGVHLNFIGNVRYNSHTITVDSTNLVGGSYSITTNLAGASLGTDPWAIAGAFRLQYDPGGGGTPETTGDIAVGATATEVRTALEALPSIGAGNVDVAYNNGSVAVEFIDALAGTDITGTLEMSTLPTNAISSVDRVARAGYGSAAQNERQNISFTSPPTGGTFTLSFDGGTTSDIAYDASAIDVQSALEALGSAIVSVEETIKGAETGAYDITRCSYDSISHAFAEDNAVRGIFFKPDGLQMYVTGAQNDKIYQYYLIDFAPPGAGMPDWPMPWNVSFAEFVGEFDISSLETTPTGLFFSPDGRKAYILGPDSNTVWQLPLSSPWAISSASVPPSASLNVSGEDATMTGIFFKPDGSKMYLVGGTDDKVYQYSLLPWDISTATYEAKSFSVVLQEPFPYDVWFNADGDKMLIIGSAFNVINQYALSTPWDVSTASFGSKQCDVSSLEPDPTGMAISPSSHKLYVVGSNSTVYQFSFMMPADEVQTISAVGTPTSGTFSLTFNSETTTSIQYDAAAADVQSALEALPSFNAGDVVCGGGPLPGDNITVTFQAAYAGTDVDLLIVGGNFTVTKVGDVWTVEFSGTYGNQDVDLMTADTSGITGSAATVSVGPVDFDIGPELLRTEIINAAPFITGADIAVTRTIYDPVTGNFEWQIIFAGQHTQKDIEQITLDDSGLSGVSIEVIEEVKGIGATEVQNLYIKLATGGTFKLTVTAAGVTATTSSIIWNTTAEGLEAQLNALPMFVDVANAVTVTDLGASDDPDIIAQFKVEFLQAFGDIPAMFSPDAAEALLCNPLVLPPVDEGPYPYPLPECSDDDLSCQSGPLLCRPGEGDPPVEIEPCCTAETVTTAANTATRIKLERDLYDPNRTACCGGTLTARELAVLKGLKTSEYTPYLRDLNANTLSPITYDQEVTIGQSIVLIESNIDSVGRRTDILQQITRKEILPSRMVWPEYAFITE